MMDPHAYAAFLKSRRALERGFAAAIADVVPGMGNTRSWLRATTALDRVPA